MTYPNAYTGAFGIYYGDDPQTGRTLMLILKRGSVFDGLSEGYGVPGGYCDLDQKEQPREAALRELAEEVIDADGQAVLSGIAPDRLILIGSGIDYKQARPAANIAGVVWHGFACRLDAAEMTTLTAYAARLREDVVYAEAVRIASRQELGGIYLMMPGDVLDKTASGLLPFAYDHERTVARAVAQTLRDGKELSLRRK